MKKYYNIAGLTVEMDTFGRTEKQAESYRTEKTEKIDVVVQSNPETIKAKYPQMSDDDCEYVSTGANFYRHLLASYNGFMLHSSAVVVDKKAYLFTARSGTGKSTHTKLWLKLLGERAYILNDDKPAVRLEDGKWYAYGTPWSGKHDINKNERVPIAGIAIVNRAEKDCITKSGGIDVVMEILRQVNKPNDSQLRAKVMELVSELLQDIPVWKLKCTMNVSAAIVAYEEMSGERLVKL